MSSHPGYDPPMRRRLWVMVVLGLLAAALFVGMRQVDRARTAHVRKPRVPEIRIGRDTPTRAAGASVERDYATVHCVGPEGASGTVWAREAGGEARTAASDDGQYNLALAPGTWSLSWQHDERWTNLGTLDLDAGDVAECQLKTRWALAGRVVNLLDEPLAGVEVWGCGDTVETDERGEFTLNPRKGECLVRARVRDGALSRHSEGAYFSVFDPLESVKLTIDDSPVAGIGVVIAQVDEGIRVDGVRPESPAEEAGLDNGDIIVAVDGHDTEGWSTYEAMDEITGDEGTVVKLEIRREGRTLDLAVRRERFEAED